MAWQPAPCMDGGGGGRWEVEVGECSGVGEWGGPPARGSDSGME